jgi:hypothetical protein
VATDLDVYLPFDGVDAFEAEWRDMFGSWLVDGVIAGLLNELEVYADSSGRQVKVKSGVVRINGEHGKSTAEKTIAVTTNASGSSRIDRLVAVVDYTANKIQFDVVAGTPGSGSPPALTDNASIRQVSLAQIGPLASGYTTIAAGAVTDERAFISSHGVAFANTAARDLWVPAPAKGFEAFDRSTLKRAAFDGSAWRVVEALGAWDTYTRRRMAAVLRSATARSSAATGRSAACAISSCSSRRARRHRSRRPSSSAYRSRELPTRSTSASSTRTGRAQTRTSAALGTRARQTTRPGSRSAIKMRHGPARPAATSIATRRSRGRPATF